MRVSPVSLFAYIFSCVFEHMLCVKHSSCTQGTSYMHASLASQFIGVHILYHKHLNGTGAFKRTLLK